MAMPIAPADTSFAHQHRQHFFSVVRAHTRIRDKSFCYHARAWDERQQMAANLEWRKKKAERKNRTAGDIFGKRKTANTCHTFYYFIIESVARRIHDDADECVVRATDG